MPRAIRIKIKLIVTDPVIRPIVKKMNEEAPTTEAERLRVKKHASIGRIHQLMLQAFSFLVISASFAIDLM